jgi:hypothetical protein
MSRYKIAVKDSKKDGSVSIRSPASKKMSDVLEALDKCAQGGDALDSSEVEPGVLYNCLKLYAKYRGLPILVNSEQEAMVIKLTYKIPVYSPATLPKEAKTVIAVKVKSFPPQVTRSLNVF